ncbi:MAG TPA: carboxypeptidase-like regulatory domain-containing protein, partial [Fimbriiglobus sp.]|nr:carboxypeptidase-like regulatory domain-containing protein [Fimbriiglobus sp.]
VKVQAFRLHELIETIRAELKGKAEKAEPEPKNAKPVPKAPPPKKAKPLAAKTGQVKGMVTLDGKPVAAGEVTVVSLALPRPRVFSAKVTDGAYAFSDELPVGKYVLIVTGKGVPEKFGTTLTSSLRVEVAGGTSELNLDLKSK